MIKTCARPGGLTPLLVAGLMLALATAPGATAAERATAAYFGDGIDLRPTVSYSQAILTVSRGETFERLVFEAGETPTLGLFDSEGELLPDGVYRWELQLVPDKQNARALRQEATLNGGQALDAWEPISDSFAIVGGSLVGPGAIEPGALRTETPSLGPAFQQARAFGAADRPAQGDDDASIGERVDVEKELRAAQTVSSARRGARATEAFQPVDPRGLERSDVGSGALRDLTAVRAAATEAAAAARTPRTTPRSDGTNGREKD